MTDRFPLRQPRRILTRATAGDPRAVRGLTVLLVALLAPALAMAALPGRAAAQAPSDAYKLGMFRDGGRTFVGVVVDDATVVDLSRADPDTPPTLRALIERWDGGWAQRIAGLAATARRDPPAYAYPLGRVTTLPPVGDPDVILMACST